MLHLHGCVIAPWLGNVLMWLPIGFYPEQLVTKANIIMFLPNVKDVQEKENVRKSSGSCVMSFMRTVSI